MRSPILAISFLLTTNVSFPLFAQPDRDVLKFDSKAAIGYAAKWCKDGNDCTSGQYKDDNNTDCTHFMAHVLKAGGVLIPGDEVSCDAKLCIRVKEMAKWFSEATSKYRNVIRVKSWREARRGDLCFLQATILGLNLGRKYHVVVLADVPKSNGANIYGHEKNRCGEFVEFDTTDCVYYRINPLNGNWQSDDLEHRFSLKIEDELVEWTENRNGRTFVCKCSLEASPEAGSLRISRMNDDEVLRFLGFPDTALRKEILAGSPEPSFIDLKIKDQKIEGVWHGLLVKKKANGTLQELVQSSKIQPKQFLFSTR
jgi:hypothetical protein